MYHWSCSNSLLGILGSLGPGLSHPKTNVIYRMKQSISWTSYCGMITKRDWLLVKPKHTIISVCETFFSVTCLYLPISFTEPVRNPVSGTSADGESEDSGASSAWSIIRFFSSLIAKVLYYFLCIWSTFPTISAASGAKKLCVFKKYSLAETKPVPTLSMLCPGML